MPAVFRKNTIFNIIKQMLIKHKCVRPLIRINKDLSVKI